MIPTAYLYDDIYMEHDTGWGHPERPDRVHAIDTRLRKESFYGNLVRVQPVSCDRVHIERIHSASYVDRVRKEIEGGTRYLDSMDTVVCEASYEIALKAAGGCVSMCDTVMAGKANRGFCSVRPPGHHAERDYAAGFCIFNNIAIAARYLQAAHGIKKIGIVDWDVHHGNGTQHSFERDGSILFISLHQYPHYPGTGASHERGSGEGTGFTMNFPMRAGSTDRDYTDIFAKEIAPALRKFGPEIILISAGFDAHNADPLSSIRLTTEAFYTFTGFLKEIAREHAGGRMIAFLEGGYNLSALAESVSRVITCFTEE